MTISPLIRQITIVVSSVLAAVSVGGAVTFPTLVIEQFRTKDAAIQLDMETKSWLGSIYGLAGIPAICMPILSQRIGRKWGYIISCVILMEGWISAYTATSAAAILVSESLNGLSTNSLLPVCFMAITEMLAPEYRHISMQAFGIAQGVGMAACGILGRYLHYKTVSIIMLVPIVAAIALAVTWLDSPYWLACRGRFDECEQAFVKLRGVDEQSKKELLELLAAQRENLTCRTQKELTRSFLEKITRRDFYMPCLDTFVLFLIMYWGGVDVIYVYFVEIVSKSTTSNDATFYSSIAMYLIVLGGFCVTGFLVKKFACKTIIKCSALTVISSLLVSSLMSGLQSVGVLPEDSLLFMFSLIAYTTCSSLGFHGIVYNMSSDVMPVKHRSLGGAFYIIINCLLYASSLKISPYISLYLGMWCTFLIYALNISVCLWYIMKYVPETKGRSLQEIEDYYTFGSFAQRRIQGDLELTQNLSQDATSHHT